MLLFVVASLTIFHFAVPARLVRELAASSGCSGRRSSSRRSSASRARSSPSASRACWTRSCSRRATGARSGSRRRSPCFAFLAVAEVVALPAFALFFHGVGWRDVAAFAARRHRHLRGRDAHRRDGGRGPRPRAAAAAALPAARDPDRRRRRRGERRRAAGSTSLFLALYDARLRAALAGPRSSTSSRRPEPRRCGTIDDRGADATRIPLPALAAATARARSRSRSRSIFFYAPTDADQGLSQRIFYFHVPIALTAYACFGWGAWKALLHLWKRDPSADLESYVAIHQGVIFGSLTLITGSIWAKISWGVWWVWCDDQLVLFLVLFLFYCAYFMLRYSVEPGLAAREHVRRLRALRRRADPDLVPRDPALAQLHPPRGLHAARPADDRQAQFLTFCVVLARDAARCSRHALPARAGRQAARPRGCASCGSSLA